MRDCASFSVLIALFFGTASLYLIANKSVALIYLGALLVEFGLFRQAAATYGVRFVKTVLAIKSVESGRSRSSASTRKK